MSESIVGQARSLNTLHNSIYRTFFEGVPYLESMGTNDGPGKIKGTRVLSGNDLDFCLKGILGWGFIWVLW